MHGPVEAVAYLAIYGFQWNVVRSTPGELCYVCGPLHLNHSNSLLWGAIFLPIQLTGYLC